jgi:IMP dehydrogenase
MSSVMGREMLLALNELGCMGIMHRFCDVDDQLKAVSGLSIRAASIEGTYSGWDRAVSLVKQDIDVLCVDVAHASNQITLDLVTELQVLTKPHKTELIIGNFATFPNIIPFCNEGPLIFKFGIGSGSMCSTRIVTGCGIPTLQSIFDICAVDFDSSQFTIADGGFKNSGDIVKALAAGANAVMIGSLLAGTDEAPGKVIKSNGALFKIYRGSASFGEKQEGKGKAEYIEGEETLVPYRGSVKDVIKQLHEGIKSGMSYNGSTNISELRENAEFVQISSSGHKESTPHRLLN